MACVACAWRLCCSTAASQLRVPDVAAVLQYCCIPVACVDSHRQHFCCCTSTASPIVLHWPLLTAVNAQSVWHHTLVRSRVDEWRAVSWPIGTINQSRDVQYYPHSELGEEGGSATEHYCWSPHVLLTKPTLLKRLKYRIFIFPSCLNAYIETAVKAVSYVMLLVWL